MKLSVIIPVYNEMQTLDALMRKVKNAQLPPKVEKEIVVVNDGSTDGTPEIIERHRGEPQVKIIHQPGNMGKTLAVMAGMEASTGDIIIIQDADLEYDPCDYPLLIEPILDKRATVVYGSRFKGRIRKMPFISRVANSISNVTLNILFGSKISDIHTCYKVFRKGALDLSGMSTKHFMFDIEITATFLSRGEAIFEVPIGYAARTKKEGKKITWLQALELYWWIIGFRLFRTVPARAG